MYSGDDLANTCYNRAHEYDTPGPSQDANVISLGKARTDEVRMKDVHLREKNPRL